jgi:hypothetical protein
VVAIRTMERPSYERDGGVDEEVGGVIKGCGVGVLANE